jgi:hypothetical protein
MTIAGLLVALGGLALVLEIGLRCKLGAPWAERLPTLRVQPDPRCGFRPMPGDVHYGYTQLIRLNNLGLRGPDVHRKKEGEYRVVVIGDTTVYGIGLADDTLLTTVLEQELNRREYFSRFRVVNLGVRAFALNQRLALLEVLADQLEPDHVVLFIGFHAFRRANIVGYYERVKERDWYMLDLEGKPTRKAVLKWQMVQLARKSATVAWGYNFYKLWRRRNEVPVRLLHGATSGEVDERLGYVRQQLDRFKAVAEGHGAQISVALVPFAQQLENDCPANRFQSAIREIAEALDISCVDLLPKLRELTRRTGRLPAAPFDEHYDAAANRVMAMQLVEHVRAMLHSTAETRPAPSSDSPAAAY